MSPEPSQPATSETLDALRRELGAELPASIAGLPDEQARALVRIVAGARHGQAAALSTAIDRGLGFIPRPARAAVKRALF